MTSRKELDHRRAIRAMQQIQDEIHERKRRQEMRVDGKADIVERLEDPNTKVTPELFQDAKEEIERLREENTEMRQLLDSIAIQTLAKKLGMTLVGDLTLKKEEEP